MSNVILNKEALNRLLSIFEETAVDELLISDKEGELVAQIVTPIFYIERKTFYHEQGIYLKQKTTQALLTNLLSSNKNRVELIPKSNQLLIKYL